MANLKAKLLWHCKTPNGWRRYPALLSKNGRIRTGVVKVGGKEREYPQGTFHLRYFDGAKAFFKAFGTDPVEALNALHQHTSLQRLKHDAEQRGDETPCTRR